MTPKLLSVDKLIESIASRQHRLERNYLITGTNHFSAIEANDALVHFAKKQGFSHREVFYIQAKFNFNQLAETLSSASLFSEKNIVDVKLENKLAKKDADNLLKIIQTPHDHLLIINAAQLASKTQKEKAIMQLTHHATVIQCPVIYANQFQTWLKNRLQRSNIHLAEEDIQRLSKATQGNLFWADQLIRQIKLFHVSSDKIDSKHMDAILANQSILQVGDLSDAILRKSNDSRSILQRLKANHISPILITAVLLKDINILLELQRGTDKDTVFSRFQTWKNKQAGYLHAKNLFQHKTLSTIIMQLADLDQISKGVKKGDEWQQLERIVFTCLR